MKTAIPLLIFLLFAHVAQSQAVLTLDACQTGAAQQYPLAKKRDLIARSETYTLENISKAWLPRVGIYGQATYQSEVVELPIDMVGAAFNTLTKDQYKFYAELNQAIFDAGATRNQKQTEKARKDVERKSLEVELYQIRQRINNLYFGILIADAQLLQNDLLIEDIRIGIKTVEAQIRNGTALRSGSDVLKAEELKTGQQNIALRDNRKAYLDLLGLFLGRELGEDTKLEKPAAPLPSAQIDRPELELFASQEKLLETGKKTIDAENRPRLNFFVQGGYGNPALNYIQEGWDAYYIGGLKMSWSFSGLYTSKKEKQIIELDKLGLDAQKETFVFNVNQEVKQQNADIRKYTEFLASDDEIIRLRASVKKAAAAQLENGVITPNDYLEEANRERLARQDKIVHEMQLLLAQYNEKTTNGN